MSQLAYRKHLQRQVVFGVRILKQCARRFNVMRCAGKPLECAAEECTANFYAVPHFPLTAPHSAHLNTAHHRVPHTNLLTYEFPYVSAYLRYCIRIRI